MAVEDRFDFKRAGKSASVGCMLLILGLIFSCISAAWVILQSANSGHIYFTFLSCAPLVLSILLALFGGFKLLMGTWEQGEIEARATHGLG